MFNQKQTIALLALTVVFISPRYGHSWGQHYLVTDRSLEGTAALEEKVKVEPIEVFLSDQSAEIKAVFEIYYSWLESRKSKRFLKVPFESSHPTRQNFLRAARLNSSTQFPLVKRLLPHEKSIGLAVPFSKISPMEEAKSPFDFRFIQATGSQMSARSVLYTFVDEPDWVLDYGLFEDSVGFGKENYAEFGYGKVPYGKLGRLSNKAAFHTQFSHEDILVRFLAPEILEGMAFERMELFSCLAKLALNSNHRYWAYRFAAWSMHYIQDLSQPYHSKAVPFGDFWYYLKFAVASDREKYKLDATQLVGNRHFAYEDFVAFYLQQSYVEKSGTYLSLARQLSLGDATLQGVSDTSALYSKVSDFSAAHAFEIDRAVSRAYGPKMTGDPTYILELDQAYNPAKVIAGIDGPAALKILDETAKDFSMAGKASRTLLRLIGFR